MYRGRSREDNKPHIYAMADEAFRSLVEEGENQSILVTLVSVESLLWAKELTSMAEVNQERGRQRILRKSFNTLLPWRLRTLQL